MQETFGVPTFIFFIFMDILRAKDVKQLVLENFCEPYAPEMLFC